mgnify:CR=1 FL=1
MTGWFRRLPGPAPVRVVIVVVAVAAAIAVLLLGYEWLGRLFLDSGGTIG